MKLRLLILCFVAFIFAACSSDDSFEPSSVKKIPITMEWIDKDGSKKICNYKYDTQNRLTEYNVTDGAEEQYKFTLSYNASGELSKMEEYAKNLLYRTHEFTYNGGTIIAKRVYSDKDPLSDNIKVDGNNRMTELEFIDKTGNYTYKYTYDKKGNITDALFCKDKEHSSTDGRTYDNKNGMLSAIDVPLWVFTYLEDNFTFFCGVNNLVSQTWTANYDETIPVATVLSISYDYDENDYPTKFTSGNDVVTITYVTTK